MQAVRQLADTVDAATPAVDVLGRTSDALLAAVPADIWCAVLLDPSTLLDTGGVHTSGFPEELMPRLFEIEHAQQLGVDNLRQLARRRAPVSMLSRSTKGDLDSSVYFQDVLRPAGMADEMRVLLREGTRTWGLLCWCRGGSAGFSSADVAAAQALAVPATSALRGSLLLAGKDTGELPDAPGLLIVDGGELVSVTPSAQRWLDDLPEDHRPSRSARELPYAVRAVLAGARTAGQTHPAFARVQCRSGRWVGLRAWATEADRTVVGIGPADFGELVAIILDAYGLTPRERDVTQHVLRGASTDQIADQLELSAYTVQDHLKKVFTKTGVTSRRDLVATIFFQHYYPALGHGPLTTDGRLLQTPPGG
jgi:DNA-binding CsgD family transcriptional regulator